MKSVGLTTEEKGYLRTIPASKKVTIKPYNVRQKEIADEIIQNIHELFPKLKVLHMGASGLEISGQGDIDIYALANSDKFEGYLPKLIIIFGKPKYKTPSSIAWEFSKDGHEVELYLTDPQHPSMKRQIKVFELLKSNKDLLKEYEKLKENMNGKPMREYQKKKYEFYHKATSSAYN